MQGVSDALKPGGRVALDVPNLPALLCGFQRHLVHRGRSDGRHVTLIRDSEIDLAGGELRQLWTWLVEGKPPRERRSSLRLYLPHQIRESLELSGFQDVQCFGSVQGEPLTIDNPRLLCVAEKPAS